MTLSSSGSIPDAVKTPCIAGGIPDGVADIAMPEIILYQAGIDPHIRQRKATGVPQHVRVDLQWQPRQSP